MPLPKIFISYSHKDEQEKDALLAQLRALRQQADIWNDDRIGAGEDWEQQINEAMEQATVAVLLITANFLASDTIARLELPKLLARHQTDGLPIVPIIARYCPWQVVDWLKQMNVRPKNGTPVWSRNSDAHEELYKLALEIVEILRATQQKQAEAVEQKQRAAKENAVAQQSGGINISGGQVSGQNIVGGNQANQVINVQPGATVIVNPPQQDKPNLAPITPPKAPNNELFLTLAPGVTFEFVRVPAGEFLMGSDKAKDKDAHDNELPQHKIYLPEYQIGKYPVTVAQFAAFVKASGHKFKFQQDVQQKANHPITHVRWHDARAFCEWVSKVTKSNVRLPSEAEWEKAARGVDGRIYPWGDDWDAKKCNTSKSGASGTARDTTPVGQYSPRGDSPYGCADMAGNVWEWTSSLLKSYPYQADDGRETLGASGYRSLRGGAFPYAARYVRCACRDYDHPDNIISDIGFRIVLRRSHSSPTSAL